MGGVPCLWFISLCIVSVTAVPLVAPCPKPAEMNSTVCLFLFTCLLTGAQCRPGGAPNTACDMGVGPDPTAHGAAPQNSTVPYVLTGLPLSGIYTPEASYPGNLLTSLYMMDKMLVLSVSIAFTERYRVRGCSGPVKWTNGNGALLYFHKNTAARTNRTLVLRRRLGEGCWAATFGC